jgi:hypothetical protein
MLVEGGFFQFLPNNFPDLSGISSTVFVTSSLSVMSEVLWWSDTMKSSSSSVKDFVISVRKF